MLRKLLNILAIFPLLISIGILSLWCLSYSPRWMFQWFRIPTLKTSQQSVEIFFNYRTVYIRRVRLLAKPEHVPDENDQQKLQAWYAAHPLPRSTSTHQVLDHQIIFSLQTSPHFE